MNKRDLVVKIASDARLSRSQAARALDAILQGLQAGLEKGDRVTISGFGTFGVSNRKARTVRNPRCGDTIEIEARAVPRFAPGSDLRSAIKRRGLETGRSLPHVGGTNANGPTYEQSHENQARMEVPETALEIPQTDPAS